MTEDRVDWHLWNWQQQHLRSREAGEGFPSVASGGLENYRSDGDSDHHYEVMCKHWGWATETVINDLEVMHGTPIYKRAIHAQLLGGPWEFPAVALGVSFRFAVPLVGKGLDRKGIV